VLDRKVVDGGIIEGTAVTQERVLELGKIGARFFRLAVVIDDDDLVGRIAGLTRQTVEATGQEFDAVAHRYDDRDSLGFLQLAFDRIRMRTPVDCDMPRLLAPLQVRLEREPAGLE